MFDLVNELARRMETAAPVYPALNLWEDADRFVLEAELPGMKPHDVEVSVVDGLLAIKGVRPAEVSETGAFLCRERAFGAFTRAVEVPAGVDAGGVEATLRDGILTVVLPKAEAAKPRRIPVKMA